MKPCTLALALSALLSAATPRPGDPAPAISAQPADAARPFPGWEALRGNIVVIDFWATWCGPCIPGLNHMAEYEKKFAGQPIRFLTVANDEMDRVRQYLKEKGITLQSFVEGSSGKTYQEWGVHGIPATALVSREGKVLGVTPGENVNEDVLRKALAGEAVSLPAANRVNNITWDRNEIEWQDGVQPLFQVVIKPIEVSGGGYAYKPGSNRISGDGMPVTAMIQAAWRTDNMHLDQRAKLPEASYRFAAVVPPGRESELFPAFQDALQRTFGFHAGWEEEEKDVLVMTHDPMFPVPESQAAQPLFQFLRGKITMKKQSAAKLAETLPNWLRKPVVDESGLAGLYDFDLEYRDDGPKMLLDGLKQKYGITLTEGKRKVKMLVIE